MNRFMLVAAVVSLAGLGACTTTERYAGGGAAIGGLGGAAIGAGLGGNTESTLLGGAIGAGAGALVGAAVAPPEDRYVRGGGYRTVPVYADRPARGPNGYGSCRYSDPRTGQRYVADCPRGYQSSGYEDPYAGY